MPHRYIGQAGEHRLLQEKDLAGLYQVAKHLLEQGRDRFVFVGLGRSPVVLTEFMRRLFGLVVYDLPLSIEATADDYGKKKVREVPLTNEMATFIRRYLPDEAIKGKGIVLIDYVDTGFSLLSAAGLMERYLRTRGFIEEAKHVYIAPLTEMVKFLKDDRSLLKGFDPNTRGAHRLLKTLKGAIDKDYFPRYARTSEKRINQGLLAVEYPDAARRLRLVVDLAIAHLGGVEQALKRLDGSAFHALRAHPDRGLDDVFGRMVQIANMRPVDLQQKEYLIDSYRRKSAREYGLPEGLFWYALDQAVVIVRRRPKLAVFGVCFFLMLCYYLFYLRSSGEDDAPGPLAQIEEIEG